MLAGRTVATGWLGTAELPLIDRPAGATRITAYFGTAETPLPGGEVADLSSATYQAAGPVSVTLPSTAPVARPDSYSTPEGRTLTVPAPGVLGNDTNADTAVLVSGPATGRLDLREDGSFSYVPPGDFVGTVTFRYTANRAGQTSDPATVTITVTESPPSGCTISGTDGNDTLTGTSGNDVICGLGGNDTITGGNGNDQIDGGPGDDTITGGNGKDSLIGGPGLDRLAGDNGSDYLDVRDGAPGDIADGGNGKDAAVRDPGDTVTGVP